MEKRTFEDFLQDICFELNDDQGILDDDMPDFFDNWLSTLDGADYIKWADLFAQERFLAGMDRAINKFKE